VRQGRSRPDIKGNPNPHPDWHPAAADVGGGATGLPRKGHGPVLLAPARSCRGHLHGQLATQQPMAAPARHAALLAGIMAGPATRKPIRCSPPSIASAWRMARPGIAARRRKLMLFGETFPASRCLKIRSTRRRRPQAGTLCRNRLRKN